MQNRVARGLGAVVTCAHMSNWSISEALTDPAIHQPITLRSEFKFTLRHIPTEITLRLYTPLHSSAVLVRQSHSISVPGLDPQEPAACEDETQEGEALQAVISQLVCTYNAGVAKGLQPDASWLQTNPDFR